MAEQKSAGSKKLADEKAEDQAPVPAEPLEDPTEVPKVKGASKLPVYNEEERILHAAEISGDFGQNTVVPDSPSGYALKQIGNLDGEDVDYSDPDQHEAARQHGEAYARIKSGVRWGYIVPGADED